MVEFLIMIFVLVICGLLFGKADTKKELLNNVGLDMSPDRYQDAKESEFKKYCIKAMNNSIDKFGCNGKDEKEFLYNLFSILDKGAFGDEENNLAYLEVKNHYIKHACTVVERRLEKLRLNNSSPLMNKCDFMQKSDAKKYIKHLWEKYQCPWPKNWLQRDGM